MANDETKDTVILEQTVTVPTSAVTLDSRTMADPKLLEKEEKKQAELAEKRRKNRIARIKAKPRTPIQVRKALLETRFRRIKSGMPHTYRKEQMVAWYKEYQIIKQSPKQWKQGCVRAKKAQSAQDFIDSLNIE